MYRMKVDSITESDTTCNWYVQYYYDIMFVDKKRERERENSNKYNNIGLKAPKKC